MKRASIKKSFQKFGSGRKKKSSLRTNIFPEASDIMDAQRHSPKHTCPAGLAVGGFITPP